MREENKKSEERKRGKGKDMQPAPLRRKVGRNGQKVSINLKHYSTNSIFQEKEDQQKEEEEQERETVEETCSQSIDVKLEEAIKQARRLGQIVTNLDTEEVTDELLKKAKTVGEEMVQLLIRDLDPLTDLEGQQREKKKEIINALNIAMDLNDLYITDFEAQLQNEETDGNQSDESTLSDQHDVKFFRKRTRVQKKETLHATVDGHKF